MADNNTRIVLTAEDKTGPALASVTGGLGKMQLAAAAANSALAAIGVTATAATMVTMVKGTIDAADGFNDLSQRVGINIRDLAGWTLAANQSGTSMEAVAKGVKTLSGYMVENGEKLRAAGITATDANGAMIQLADLFKAMPDGIHKTALATQLFGKAGMDMIPMLNMGSAGLAEAKAKADEYGRRIAEIAPDADKFNDQLAEMALQSKGVGISIAQYFLPGLIGLSQWLIDVKSNGEAAFTAIEWMFGERVAKAAGLAGMGGRGLKRESSGKIGGQKPQGISAADEEALGEKNGAILTAMGLLDKEKEKAGAAAKYKRSFDPEGDLAYARAEREFQEGKKRAIAVEKEMDALDEKARKMDEAHMARMESNRIESEGEEAIRLQMEKTSRELAKQKSLADDLGLSFSSAFEDAVVAGNGFSEVLKGLSQDVARIITRKSITEPMGNAVSGLVKESGITDWFKDLLKFDGGGFTGGGARSGGLDGQGGFLAMMHPQETVIDHTRGGSGGGTQNHFTVDMRGASVEAVARLERLVASVNGSIERRAMGVMSQARVRGA